MRPNPMVGVDILRVAIRRRGTRFIEPGGKFKNIVFCSFCLSDHVGSVARAMGNGRERD